MKFLGKLIVALMVVGAVVFFWPEDSAKGKVQNATNCSNCHVMQNWVTSWQKSSHGQVACLTCHQDLDWVEMIGKNWTGAEVIRYPQNLSAGCLQCHNPQRPVTPSGELIVPHELHAIKGVDCLDCHSSIGHQVEQNTQFSVPAVPMDRCMECHNGAMAPSDCKACHKEIIYPDNHSVSTWSTEHGQEALNKFNCSKCHNRKAAELLLERSPTDNFELVRNYSFRTQLCWECHQKKPTSHNSEAFARSHGTKQPQGCYICHQQNSTEELTELPAKVACSKCHEGVDHPANWRAVHKQEVKEEGSTQCYRCHQPENCFACHSAQL